MNEDGGLRVLGIRGGDLKLGGLHRRDCYWVGGRGRCEGASIAVAFWILVKRAKREGGGRGFGGDDLRRKKEAIRLKRGGVLVFRENEVSGFKAEGNIKGEAIILRNEEEETKF